MLNYWLKFVCDKTVCTVVAVVWISAPLSQRLKNSRPSSSSFAPVRHYSCVWVCGSEILWRKCTEAKSQATERDRTGSSDAYITGLLSGSTFDMSHTNVYDQPPTLTPVHNPNPYMYQVGQVSEGGTFWPPVNWNSMFVWWGRLTWMFRPMVCKLLLLWINI